VGRYRIEAATTQSSLVRSGAPAPHGMLVGRVVVEDHVATDIHLTVFGKPRQQPRWSALSFMATPQRASVS